MNETTNGAEAPKTNAGNVVDQTIRRALKAYKLEHNLTNRQLAVQLGQSSPTIVSAYLNDQPRGSWMQLQARAVDLLENVKRRSESGLLPLRETPSSRQFAAVMELIRKTNDVAVVHGEAGVGKTCSIALYAQRNANTVTVCATIYKNDVKGLVNALMEQLGWNTWDYRTPRSVWLEQRFKDSSRLIIIDNAHRLSRQALSWLCDFHDATRCPVALVGNPEVLDKIRPSDQSSSRVVEIGKKLQKICNVRKSTIRPGDELELCEWKGEPFRSKQRLIRQATCRAVYSIEIDASGGLWLDGVEAGEKIRGYFAKADGFASYSDLLAYIRESHGLPFKGVVIVWMPENGGAR